MKRWLLLSIIWSWVLLTIPLPALAERQQLIILNWSDYLDPELVIRFEREYQARVIQVYYDSDDNRTQMLLENNADGYDLILTSGADLQLYAKRRWIRPLDFQRIPNSQHINPSWHSAFAQAEQYGLPYFWGTMGIVYREDRVSAPITRWKQLLQPSQELQGKIAMVDSAWDLLGIALKAAGYSMNSEQPEELKTAGDLLLSQKNHVRTYSYIPLDKTSPIVSGDIVAAVIYSGDSLMLAQQHTQLKYVLPEEGSNIWVDYFTIGQRARNPELAYQFLDFINQPKNAAQQAQFVYYATPNLAAEALLPEAFLTNPIIYPDKARLASSEFYQIPPVRALRLRNQIVGRVLR